MNMYNHAHEMLEKNIQCIPLNRFKKPFFEFADIEITKQFIEQKKSMYQRTSVLGALTREIWCIDLDTDDEIPNRTGLDVLKERGFYDDFKASAKRTMLQKTPSGGFHAIFKKNDDIEYSQKIRYLDLVDIKAHNNNYFVLAGSVTRAGTYVSNDVEPVHYAGDFEKTIFERAGNYSQQIDDRYSVKNVLQSYDFSHLDSTGTGKGKDAYERIINNMSIERNNDLFLASSYAKQCNVDIEPLKILIGDIKANGDVLTEREFYATVESAR